MHACLCLCSLLLIDLHAHREMRLTAPAAVYEEAADEIRSDNEPDDDGVGEDRDKHAHRGGAAGKRTWAKKKKDARLNHIRTQ